MEILEYGPIYGIPIVAEVTNRSQNRLINRMMTSKPLTAGSERETIKLSFSISITFLLLVTVTRKEYGMQKSIGPLNFSHKTAINR